MEAGPAASYEEEAPGLFQGEEAGVDWEVSWGAASTASQ